MTEALSSDPKKPRTPHAPTQERSQAHLEASVNTSLQLIASSDYERLSLGEIARESGLRIAPLHRYLPVKLSIAREAWLRFTTAITESREGVLRRVNDGATPADAEALKEHLIDWRLETRIGHPGFLKIRGGAEASTERREHDREDTIKAAGMGLRRFASPTPAHGQDEPAGLAEGATAIAKLILTFPAKSDHLLGRSKAAFDSFTAVPSGHSPSRPSTS